MKITGKVWTGFVGECKIDKRVPCYIIKRHGGNGYFPCGFLKKFVNKKVIIEVKEAR